MRWEQGNKPKRLLLAANKGYTIRNGGQEGQTSLCWIPFGIYRRCLGEFDVFTYPNPDTTLALHAKKYRIYSYLLNVDLKFTPFLLEQGIFDVQCDHISEYSTQGYVLSNSHDHSRRRS